MDTPLVRRVARPYFVRAALVGIVALAGLVVAESLGDPRNAGLVEKLTTSTGPQPGITGLDEPDVTDVVTENEAIEDVTGGDLAALAGAIVFLVGGVVAVRALTRGAGRAVEQQLGDARGAPLSLIISVVGHVILAIAVLELLGVDLGGLLLGGAITGVVVGIAAQQTLGNAFAGMVLLIVRPFVVGEHIVLKSGALGGEYEGRVTDISLFYVDLETVRGPVKLPNAGVLAAAVGPGARSATGEADEGEETAAPGTSETGT
jgi:small-conductance mechanosensitive channel